MPSKASTESSASSHSRVSVGSRSWSNVSLPLWRCFCASSCRQTDLRRSVCFKKCISHASKRRLRFQRDLLESSDDISPLRGYSPAPVAEKWHRSSDPVREIGHDTNGAIGAELALLAQSSTVKAARWQSTSKKSFVRRPKPLAGWRPSVPNSLDWRR